MTTHVSKGVLRWLCQSRISAPDWEAACGSDEKDFIYFLNVARMIGFKDSFRFKYGDTSITCDKCAVLLDQALESTKINASDWHL